MSEFAYAKLLQTTDNERRILIESASQQKQRVTDILRIKTSGHGILMKGRIKGVHFSRGTM